LRALAVGGATAALCGASGDGVNGFGALKRRRAPPSGAPAAAGVRAAAASPRNAGEGAMGTIGAIAAAGEAASPSRAAARAAAAADSGGSLAPDEN
jgi:hypothetical protein